jgi:threonine aldolase
VATGTAANALALACLCPPWGAVYCHRNAHVQEDECGAPEFYTGGAKLAAGGGRARPDRPGGAGRGDRAVGRQGVHNVQPGAVTLTNATEAGAVYTARSGGRRSRIAKARGLPVHMDGARFANALVAAAARRRR